MAEYAEHDVGQQKAHFSKHTRAISYSLKDIEKALTGPYRLTFDESKGAVAADLWKLAEECIALAYQIVPEQKRVL
jgi:hypothetical protein